MKRGWFAAALCAAVSLMSVSVSADNNNAKIGTAAIYLADETWSEQQYWGEKSSVNLGIASAKLAEITGDGTYTASVEFTDIMKYGQFFGLYTDMAGTGSGSENSSFADYPEAKMAIVSVKADGTEIAGNADAPDINNESGLISISIFDPWAEDASQNYAYSLDWSEGIKTIEVTFTVTGTGIPEDKPDDENEDGKSDDDDDSATDDTPADDGKEDDEGTTAPPLPDSVTDAADTGNIPSYAMLLVMAAAGIGAVVSKKKKLS